MGLGVDRPAKFQPRKPTEKQEKQMYWFSWGSQKKRGFNRGFRVPIRLRKEYSTRKKWLRSQQLLQEDPHFCVKSWEQRQVPEESRSLFAAPEFPRLLQGTFVFAALYLFCTPYISPGLFGNLLSFCFLLNLWRFVRRELSSLRPVHSAIASACLVSKLPSYTNSCGEGIPLDPLEG